MSDTGVYTVYSYEDQEIKDIFESKIAANQWVSENREGNEEDCKIEYWIVQKEVKK